MYNKTYCKDLNKVTFTIMFTKDEKHHYIAILQGIRMSLSLF